MTVFLGDCRDVMRTMANNSVDSIVTDPPYELGFMGKSWDSTGVAYDVTVWQECLRVLKPGGHLLAFGGSRTYHRLAVAIEDAGFQIRDQIMWVYGSGFPKSLNIGKAIDKQAGAEREVIGIRTDGMSSTAMKPDKGWNANSMGSVLDVTAPATAEAKQWDGWGTALKPAHEPIVMARKPLDGTVANNVLTHGVGGINIDGCRVGNEIIKTSGGRSVAITGDERVGAALGMYGESTPLNTEHQGRFPANFIHDGSDEVLELFPNTKSGKMNQHIEGGNFNVFGKQYPRDVETIGDSGSASRFFYCAKANKKDRNEGLDGFENRSAGEVTDRKDGSAGLQNPRAGAGRTTGNQNFHPTVKPTDLMRYLCRLVTPPNGTVLDPFTGSGSTGKAATLEGFNFIGIEQSAEYVEIANARIEHAQQSL